MSKATTLDILVPSRRGGMPILSKARKIAIVGALAVAPVQEKGR